MKDLRCPICGEKLGILETDEYDCQRDIYIDHFAYACKCCEYKQYWSYDEDDKEFMIRDMEDFIEKVNQLKKSK